MKIRILSDLHLEFSEGTMDIPMMDDEKDQVLVLAGDIGLSKRPTTYTYFFEDIFEGFRDVIYIMGNHEYYRSSYEGTIPQIKDNVDYLPNVHVLENETFVIDNTAFICATLWTDYHRNNPLALDVARMRLNDHRFISHEGGMFTPELAYEKHMASKNFIFTEVKNLKSQGMKVVVVTHHCPSELSIHERYQGPENYLLNSAFASSLDEEILATEPDLWIHGHTHDSFDYMIGKTRVVCNPRGYKGSDLNTAFNPELVIEV